MSEEKPRIGVGIIIIKDNTILWGKRKGSFGAGLWGGVGGHLEYGETAEECILREISEECGVRVKNLRLLCVSDFLTHYPRHYIDIGFVAEWEAGEPQVLETEKLEKWEWRDIDDTPAEAFAPMLGYIEAYKTGKNYFTYPAPAQV